VSNTAVGTLLDSLALTSGPEFATNKDTGGDTGLTLPGGSVEGIFETVVAHHGYSRNKVSDGVGNYILPNETGLYPHLQEVDLNFAVQRGKRPLTPKYSANATPTCHGFFEVTS